MSTTIVPTDTPAGGRQGPSGAPDGSPDATSPVTRGSTPFALFAEVLLTGVYVAALSVLVVTALPAVTAGVAHLRRHLAGTDDSVGSVWSDFREACRGVWLVSLATVVVLFLVVLDLWAVSTGALPGGPLVGAVSAAVGAGVLVALLRAAQSWTPGTAWWPLVGAAARTVSADPVGSLMLLAAVAVCVVLVWMLTPLLVAVGGLLAFAVVAVDVRSGGGAGARG